MTSSCCSPTAQKTRFAALRRLKNWLLSPWSLSLILLGLVAVFDPTQAWPRLRVAFDSLLGTLPYIVAAVLLVAYLKAAKADALMASAFHGRQGRMIVIAALVGGLAPFCSCEVIPFIAGLLSLGTPVAPIMAFWLSSPLIDPGSLLITANTLGWSYAVFKAVAAVGLGVFAGMMVWGMQASFGLFASPLKARGSASPACCNDSHTPQGLNWQFWQEAPRRTLFRQEAVSNFFFLLKWLFFAYVIQALMLRYVPSTYITAWVGDDGLSSIALGALVGMPAYLNAFAAPALVAGLVQQGMSSGAAMAFLIAGSLSCIPAMAAVWSLVRWPLFVAYIGLGLLGAFWAGLVFQLAVVTG